MQTNQNTSPGSPLDQAQAWLESGHHVALATVVKTWGSAPRPAGSMLVIRGDGLFEGSVSGGCVEGAVITEALDMIGKPGAKTLSFGVTNDEAWEVGLACGGQIDILLETIAPIAGSSKPQQQTP
ncbi:MAG: XdhC family protein [Pseudomonadota bacterium]